MRLERVTVAGVLRFDTPVTLNMADVPPGLVAVVGANGAGKSTLVEAPIATLYRTFPSRAERELIDYAHGRDSYLEAVVSVRGRGTYRARVNLDAAKRTTDAVLEHTDEHGVTRLLNDGKVSTYDAAIAETFPAYSVLLASAVAAQNRVGSFVTLDRRGRKDLFTRLLGLDRYEDMAATARQAAALIHAALRSAEGEFGMADRLGEPAVGKELALDRDEADERRHAARTRLDEVATALDTQAAALDALQGAHAAHAAAAAALDARRRELSGLIRRRDTDLPEAIERIERSHARDVAALTQTRDAKVRDLGGRLQNNRGVLDQAAAIRDAVAKTAAATEQRDAINATLHELRLFTREKQVAIAAKSEHIVIAQAAANDLQDATRRAGLLNAVPCGGHGDYAACSLLADAERARQAIPELTVRAAAVTSLTIARDVLMDDLAKVDARVASLVGEQAAIEKTIALLAPLAGLAPRLDIAEARIAEIEADLARAQKECAAEIDRQREQAQRAKAEAARDLGLVVRDIKACQDAIDELVNDVAAHADAEAQLATVRAAIASLDAERARLLVDVTKAEGDIERLDRELAQWHAHKQTRDRLEQTIRTLRQEHEEWLLLSRAFGRDGLPVLEIDAAGPTVSAFCNDLLSVCFGPRFSVDLVTQSEKADGKGMKEVFELRVIDNLRGGDPRDLADLSGGEQILVDEALKNALALFITGRQAGAIETCWRDETTGPLDGENAHRYVEMLRRVLELGGFRHIVMVSHNAAASALADTIVRVDDGQITIERSAA